MNAVTKVRFAMSLLAATVVCIGMFADILGFGFGWIVIYLLAFKRAELTQAIPHNESRSTFIGIGVFLAVMLTLPFLHLPKIPSPSGALRHWLAVALWGFWISVICWKWRWEKQRGNADQSIYSSAPH
jgi:hypothetical protein